MQNSVYALDIEIYIGWPLVIHCVKWDKHIAYLNPLQLICLQQVPRTHASNEVVHFSYKNPVPFHQL
jgi:hypothetical protein